MWWKCIGHHRWKCIADHNWWRYIVGYEENGIHCAMSRLSGFYPALKYVHKIARKSTSYFPVSSWNFSYSRILQNYQRHSLCFKTVGRYDECCFQNIGFLFSAWPKEVLFSKQGLSLFPHKIETIWDLVRRLKAQREMGSSNNFNHATKKQKLKNWYFIFVKTCSKI